MSIFDILKDDKFLEKKFNYNLQNESNDYNIKDFQIANDIDFVPTNHFNNTLQNTQKNIDYNKIANYLKKNNIILPLDIIKDCFNTYLLHNDVRTLSEEDMLKDFHKMINFYNQFYKRSIPVFNNKKQDKVAFIEEKRTELPNNLRQANGFAKSMQYHNNQYKKDKFNINNTSKQNNIPIVQKTQTTIFNNIISNIQTWIKN
jgi:hypothetical protein